MPQVSNDAQGSSQEGLNAPNGFPPQGTSAISTKEPRAGAGVTFAHQDDLPRLPIPDLEVTSSRYLDALKPLQSAREHEDTEAAVKDFVRKDGPELQDRLRKYATGKSSYIEEFWYDSYLNFDNPVVLNLNPFFLLEDDPTPARNDQVTRAASLVVSALAFARAIRKEELPPDMLRGQPLDMYQYSRIFGTSRIPTENGCVIGQDPAAKHLVVLCRGQFYWFDVLDDNSDTIMAEKDIALNLRVIVEDAEKTPVQDAARGALGVLSTENRKIWADLRDILTSEEGSNNSDCLGIVDRALFILCLDDTEPGTTHDLCTNMLCGTNIIEKGVQVGTCMNRWYDKLQIIVCKNGSAGINFEHTGVDGHTVLRMASDVYTDTILRFARTINGRAPSLWASSSPDPSKRDPESFGDVTTTPHKLEWDMLPELRTALRFAETRLADLIQQNEFRTLEFVGYGKNFITSMGLSPDAFVQMAFQAGYYGLYGRLECTYEPAMTKIFLHGRTEAIRTVTAECVEFVRTFWAENPAEKKVEALRKACQKHTAVTKECAKALGQDRHLYALYCVWQRAVDANGVEPSSNGDDDVANGDGSSSVGVGEPSEQTTNGKRQSSARSIPAIFADAGWAKLNTTILSTSNCGNPSLRHFGFGPTSSDGFGIGYIIKEDSISICASSKHRQTKRYMDALESYFNEMRRLLRQVQQRRGARGAVNVSRAREVESEERMSASKSSGRLNRGRMIDTDASKRSVDNLTDEAVELYEDDDGLGGYGFFDAGQLLQALSVRSPSSARLNTSSPSANSLSSSANNPTAVPPLPTSTHHGNVVSSSPTTSADNTVDGKSNDPHDIGDDRHGESAHQEKLGIDGDAAVVEGDVDGASVPASSSRRGVVGKKLTLSDY